MFEKTKNFIDDHRKEITTAVVTATVVAGCAVGIHLGRKYNLLKCLERNDAMNTIYRVLKDIPDGTKVRVYGGIFDRGVVPNELGEIGKDMIARGADEFGDAFTHFIAIKKET